MKQKEGRLEGFFTSPFNIYSMLAHPLTEVKGQKYYASYGFVCLNLDCQSVG